MFHAAARSTYLRQATILPYKVKRVRRIIRCQRRAVSRRIARKVLPRYKAQHARRFYWEIRWMRIPIGWQNWAHSTAECESRHGTDPRTNLNGFRGIFQWEMPTWRSAGGTGDPAYAGFFHEAVIAVGLARREGTGHWPRCG